MSFNLEGLRRVPCAGIILALLSGVCFASANFIVKLIPHMNPVEISISRGVVQFLVNIPVICWKRMPIFGAPGERRLLIIRGCTGSFDVLIFYAALRMASLSDASTIVFSAPVFVYFFGCLFLHEEFGHFQILTVTVAMAGVLLISKPTFLFGDMDPDILNISSSSRTVGLILALVSSIMLAADIIFMRMLEKTPTTVVTNSYAMGAMVIGTATLLILRNFFYEEAGSLAEGVGFPNTNELFYMIVNGLAAALGQLGLSLALKIENASLCSLAQTINIVMAFVYQSFWLPDEVVHWTSILGASIVCASVAVTTIRRWLMEKPGKWETFWQTLNCFMAPERKICDRGTQTRTSMDRVDALNLA